ncbi:MAG: hypothetical protein GXW96_04560 [Christensenellaceae bacterium]|nr:hypothetical protein [Christensenellaceae bacterium]
MRQLAEERAATQYLMVFVGAGIIHKEGINHMHVELIRLCINHLYDKVFNEYALMILSFAAGNGGLTECSQP